MSKDTTTLKNQIPQWIAENEPVSGDPNPSGKDVTVNPDGSLSHNILGVDNRIPATMWGNLKLMTEIFELEHNPDGTHKVVSSSDISKYLSYGARYNNFINGVYGQPNGYLSNTVSIASTGVPVSSLPVTNGKFRYRDTVISLKESNNTSGTDSLISISGDQLLVVFYEFWFHNVDTSGYAFPLGNTEYKNTNTASDPFIPFPHSDQKILKTDPTFLTFATNPDNLIFSGNDGTLYQLVYRLRSSTFDYVNYKDGVNDPSITATIGGNSFTIPKNGVWFTSDNRFALPVYIVSRRNKGIYHETINPNGTAKLRTGATMPTTLAGLMDQNNIAYMDNTGTELTNYSATYDSSTDTYTDSGTTYYRSGNSQSTVSGNPDTLFEDMVYDEDLIKFKQKPVANPNTAADEIINSLFANQLKAGFSSILYGNISSPSYNNTSGNIYQLLGFGTSANALFGNNNTAGAFVDKLNNNADGTLDNVRYIFRDTVQAMRAPFQFIEGNAGSESPANFVTYDPVSRAVSLDTTALNDNPVFDTLNPVLTWENGDTVTLSTAWTGAGSTSMSCVIDAADVTAHSGQKVYGEVTLNYPVLGGQSLLIDNVKSTKIGSTDHPFSYDVDLTSYNNSHNGAIQSGTSTVVTLNAGASSTNDEYKDQYLVFLTSANGIPFTEVKKITAYNGTTKEATLDSALSNTPSAGDIVSISPLDPSAESTILISKADKGIAGAVMRRVVQVTSSAAYPNIYPVLQAIASSGAPTIKGTVVESPNGTILDILYIDNSIATQGLVVKFKPLPGSIDLWQSAPSTGEVEIMHTGYLFTTNVGTANFPNDAYMNMLPGINIPYVDSVTSIGTALTPVTQITPLQLHAWDKLLPYSGLKVDLSTKNTNLNIPLQSNMTVTSGDGFMIGAMLVRHEGNVKVFASIRMNGTFGFTSSDNLYLIDVNRFFGLV